MSKTSSIYAIVEWASPITGVAVDFHRDHSLHMYRNPSVSSMSRLADLIISNPSAFKMTPWATGGIVGWYADVQLETPEMEEVSR